MQIPRPETPEEFERRTGWRKGLPPSSPTVDRRSNPASDELKKVGFLSVAIPVVGALAIYVILFLGPLWLNGVI